MLTGVNHYINIYSKLKIFESTTENHENHSLVDIIYFAI